MKQSIKFPELPKGRNPEFPGEASGRGEEEEERPLVVDEIPNPASETESCPAQDLALDDKPLLCQVVASKA